MTNNTFIIIVLLYYFHFTGIVDFTWHLLDIVFLELFLGLFFQTFGGCQPVLIEIQCDGYSYNAFIYLNE